MSGQQGPERGSPEQGKYREHGPVVAVLAIDDVENAHHRAFDIALDLCEDGKTVAHLHADPNVRTITFHSDGSHDLANAITTIPTSSGRLIKIAIGGLLRPQVSEILTSVRPLVDHVLLSGPEPALTQPSLEIATLADSAVCLGGTEAHAHRLRLILDQLDIGHSQSPPSGPSKPIPGNRNQKIVPPGRL